MNKPKNENYCATVIEIKTLIPLVGCNNVQAAIIMGQQVIVGKDVKVGDIGLFFPVECALSKEYLTANNLYRVHKNKPNLNSDTTVKGGYFEESGRIRCAKFLGHKSEGLFMPISSLEFIKTRERQLSLGDCVDEWENIPICSKYIVKQNRTPGAPGSGKLRNKQPKETKIIDGQFRFHEDTSMLFRNLHKIQPDSLISITYKMHGTSGISSYVLCKKQLNWKEKFLSKWFKIETNQYDYLYSSRKVIKNSDLNPNAEHFYGIDIWGLAHEVVKPFLQKGFSFYYEIVGYLPSGAGIQGKFDYGESPLASRTFGVYIYRITSTNVDGKVIEFSAKQVQDYCKQLGLNVVPELYYGRACDLFSYSGNQDDLEKWRNEFLEFLKLNYNEKDCYMCKNKVPEEGVVIRLEKNDIEAYKCKSTRFYEFETAELDKGEANIEDEN